jgi:hypothetical protein
MVGDSFQDQAEIKRFPMRRFSALEVFCGALLVAEALVPEVGWMDVERQSVQRPLTILRKTLASTPYKTTGPVEV